jgi:hypothetical protein
LARCIAVSPRARREVLDVDQALDGTPELHRHAARHLDVRTLVAEKVSSHRDEIEWRAGVCEGAHDFTERGHGPVLVDRDLGPRRARELDCARRELVGTQRAPRQIVHRRAHLAEVVLGGTAQPLDLEGSLHPPSSAASPETAGAASAGASIAASPSVPASVDDSTWDASTQPVLPEGPSAQDVASTTPEMPELEPEPEDPLKPELEPEPDDPLKPELDPDSPPPSRLEPASSPGRHALMPRTVAALDAATSCSRSRLGRGPLR